MSVASDAFNAWVCGVFPSSIPQEVRDTLKLAFYAGTMIGALAEQDTALQMVKDIRHEIHTRREVTNVSPN